MKINIAIEEYKRLCSLINKPPYGDCQLVALMLFFKVGGDIVRGELVMEDGKLVDHFWLEIDGQVCDPLSKDWTRDVESREKKENIEPQQIIDDWQKFITDFPQPAKYELFPLRWAVKDEILKYIGDKNNEI